MATRDINLLHERQITTPQDQARRTAVKSWMFYGLGIYLVILIAIFLASFYISNQLASVETSVTTERARIRALEKNEGAFLLLKQKAQALVQILQGRFAYQDFFTLTRQLAGDDAKIKGMRLTKSGGIELDVAVANSEALDRYIISLLAASKTRFRRIELGSVRSTNVGEYELTLRLNTIREATSDANVNSL